MLPGREPVTTRLTLLFPNGHVVGAARLAQPAATAPIWLLALPSWTPILIALSYLHG
jgi:hypothetical protein